jgi:hypothetical protein
MFEIDPTEIEPLDGAQLVQLLRRLVHAEALDADVPLRGVTVPVQITIADGGEDARVSWSGGRTKTDYFPCRFVVFQCKARDGGDAKWKAEVWTKPSQKRGMARELNSAVRLTLQKRGAYIGVTASALVGDVAKKRIEAIKTGIRDAGGDPDRLKSIELLDANKLAAWANRHPAVALWVKEQKAQMPLAGFSTLEQWGHRTDVAKPAYVDSANRRFLLKSGVGGELDFKQFATRVVDHLAEPGYAARITGPSGVGKTRALHRALTTAPGIVGAVTVISAIYCDYREVATKLFDAVNGLIKQRSATLFVIDECPYDVAIKLNNLAASTGSRLRVVTIDTNPRAVETPNCLLLSPDAADDDTITGIITAYLGKTASPTDAGYIAELCAGFPKIAVLAGQSYAGEPHAVVRSADDVAERILARAGLTEREQLRALGSLALFDDLHPDAAAGEFDSVAEVFAGMSGDVMYEHLVTGGEHGLVGRYGTAMVVQPRPIATYLALKRLSHLRVSTLERFFDGASAALKASMQKRWRHLGRSPTLRQLTDKYLNYYGPLSGENLLTAQGSAFIDAAVHVVPETASLALSYAIHQASLETLAERLGELEGVLNALQRLAFGRETFPGAARALFRVAASSDKVLSGRPNEIIQRLFSRELSGTEADAGARYFVLDEQIAGADPAMRPVCVEALIGTLSVRDFMRNGGFESLGDQPPRHDWSPADGEARVDFHRQGLKRLRVAWSDWPEHRDTIETALAEHLRQLLVAPLFEVVFELVTMIAATKGFWPGAAKAIGDWLYFERGDPKAEFPVKVRALYDRMFPSGLVDRVVLYCAFWPADIRDPDARYGDGVSDRDYEYSAREARKLAPEVAADPATLRQVVELLATREMHAPQAFAIALASCVTDPLWVLALALDALDAASTKVGSTFVRSLMAALEKAFPDQADALFEKAKASATFAANRVELYYAVEKTEQRLVEVAAGVRDGTIAPSNTIGLSYGRGLEALPVAVIAILIDALIEGGSDEGPWAALEILSMVKHGADTLAGDEATLIRHAILAAVKGGGAPRGTMAGHALKTLAELLGQADRIDEAFAEAFAEGLVLRCQSPHGGLYGGTEAYQTVLKLILRHAPAAAWRVITDFYLVASPAERDRLSRMVSEHRAYGEDRSFSSAGPMAVTPLEMALAWTDEDPARRVGFVVGYLPLLGDTVETAHTWSPQITTLAARYGEVGAFRSALAARLSRGAWMGSNDGEAKILKGPLQAWTKLDTLGPWANEQLTILERGLRTSF